jgi:metallo-beta-lactamase family protein
MSRRPKIIHIGGEKCVTGSCHLLQVKGLNIMVDCGLTQGHDAGAPMDSWPVRPDQVDFLFLTHAHIDHIGRLPELIQKGFKGEIIRRAGHPAGTFSGMPASRADMCTWKGKKLR